MKPYHIISALIVMVAIILDGVITVELTLAQTHSKEMSQKDNVNLSQKERLDVEQRRNPFFLPPGVHLLSNDKTESKLETPSPDLSPPKVVKAILISKNIRLAVIGRHIVTIGDSINDEKILDIKPDKVILGKGDKKRDLFLYQSPIPIIQEEK